MDIQKSSSDEMVRNMKRYFNNPQLSRRIDDLVATGRYNVDDYNVSNPQVYTDYIMDRLKWVKRVIVLVEGEMRNAVRRGRVTTDMLTRTAINQGYRNADIDAIQKDEAAVFIQQPAGPHWIAAIPTSRYTCRMKRV